MVAGSKDAVVRFAFAQMLWKQSQTKLSILNTFLATLSLFISAQLAIDIIDS